MSEFQQKEKIHGIFLPTNEEIKFNKVWGNHTFTEQEAADLLAGKTISFDSVSKSGKDYVCSGKLTQQEYNGHKFWGFEMSTDVVPNEWCGHVFTDEEKEDLRAGNKIYVDDCVSKKTGGYFSCLLVFGEDNGRKKIMPIFS